MAMFGKRYDLWGRRWSLLSQASRTCLIKSIAAGVYLMSSLGYPETVCSKIDALLREFWWGKRDSNRTIYYISKGMGYHLPNKKYRWTWPSKNERCKQSLSHLIRMECSCTRRKNFGWNFSLRNTCRVNLYVKQYMELSFLGMEIDFEY